MTHYRGKGRAFVNVLLVTLMLVLYLATSTPIAQSAIGELYNSPVYRGQEKGVVGFECAVSWNASALPELLSILEENKLRITFMVSGEWAEENSKLLREMVRSGHEIGTMGQEPMRDGGADFLFADISHSLKSIYEASGVFAELYYSGARTIKNSTQAALKLGLTHVLCTTDLLSGRGLASDISSRALDKPFDGTILLIQPTAEAIKAMPECIEDFDKLGLRIVTVSEALGEYKQRKV